MREEGQSIRRDEGAEPPVARLGSVGVAASYYAILWVLWQHVPLARHPWLVALALVLFLAGSGFLIASVVPTTTRRLGSVASLALIVGVAIRVAIVAEYQWVGYRTDSIVLSHEAAALVLEGQNPYPVDLSPAYERFHLPRELVTPLESGGLVDHVTYPALNFLAHVPYLWLGGTDLRYSVLLFQLATLLLIHRRTPAALRPWTLLPLVIDHTTIDFAAASVTDFVWVLPMAACVVAWRRWAWSACCLGLACAVKQPPWLALPFVLVRVFLEEHGRSPTRRAWSAARFAAVTAAAFLVPNAAFLWADPRAFSDAVFANFRLPMVTFGEGLSLLSQHGVASLGRAEYAALMLATLMLLLAILVLWHPRTRGLPWVAPVVLLWFSHRGFHSYWVAWLPIVVLGILENWGDPDAADAPATSSRTSRGRVLGTVAVVGGWLVVAALVWVRAGGAADAPGLAEVLRVRNRACQGWICSIRVRVENRSTEPLTPVFDVQRGNWQPLRWETREGPPVLAPHTSAVFEIVTAERGAMVSPGADLRVVVRDSSASGGRSFASDSLSWWAIREAIRLQSEAQLALRSNDVERAIGLLEEARLAHPTSPAVEHRLRDAYARAGRSAEAAAAAARALELDPSGTEALDDSADSLAQRPAEAP